MKKIILSIVLVNLLAACASEKPKDAVNAPAGENAATAGATASATGDAATAPATQTSEMAAAPVAAATTGDAANAPAAGGADGAMPTNNSVFFPFDVDAVQPNDRATVQAFGAYLGKNKGAKVRVEGNADERGSSEYNLALGQRRANNVKKLLVLSGAKTAQIETVSFGEEKPRCSEHEESCWSQNRRADIVAK